MPPMSSNAKPIEDVLSDFIKYRKIKLSNNEKLRVLQNWKEQNIDGTRYLSDETLTKLIEKDKQGLLRPRLVKRVGVEIYKRYIRMKDAQQDIKLKSLEDKLRPSNIPSFRVINRVDLKCPPAELELLNACEDYVIKDNTVIPARNVGSRKCTGFWCQRNPIRPVHQLSNYENCCAEVIAYGEDKRLIHALRARPGSLIKECGSTCGCDPLTCKNRVVSASFQNNNNGFIVYRKRNDDGWGVKISTEVRRGTFVCIITGAVIARSKAMQRLTENALTKTIYDKPYEMCLHRLQFEGAGATFFLDTSKFGNFSSLIRHSMEPNLTAYGVITGDYPNIPYLALFANADIPEGGEITYNFYQMRI